jgi:hypothetical protein
MDLHSRLREYPNGLLNDVSYTYNRYRKQSTYRAFGKSLPMFAVGARGLICGAGVEPSTVLLLPLYQPRMICGEDCGAVSGMNEWQGIHILGGNLLHCRSVHHRSHMI